MEIVTVIGTRIHQTYETAIAISALPSTPEPTESLSYVPDASYPPDISGIQAQAATDRAAEWRHLHPDPLEWLDYIKKLREAGRKARADQELGFFHDAYPAFPVPPVTPATDGGTQ